MTSLVTGIVGVHRPGVNVKDIICENPSNYADTSVPLVHLAHMDAKSSPKSTSSRPMNMQNANNNNNNNNRNVDRIDDRDRRNDERRGDRRDRRGERRNSRSRGERRPDRRQNDRNERNIRNDERSDRNERNIRNDERSSRDRPVRTERDYFREPLSDGSERQPLRRRNRDYLGRDQPDRDRSRSIQRPSQPREAGKTNDNRDKSLPRATTRKGSSRDRSLPRAGGGGKGGKERYRWNPKERDEKIPRAGGPMDLKSGETYDKIVRLEETGQAAAVPEADRVHKEIDFTLKGGIIKDISQEKDVEKVEEKKDEPKDKIKEYMNDWNNGAKDEWYSGKDKWTGSWDKKKSKETARSTQHKEKKSKETADWNAKDGWSNEAWKKWEDDWNKSWENTDSWNAKKDAWNAPAENDPWAAPTGRTRERKKVAPVSLSERTAEEKAQYEAMLAAASAAPMKGGKGAKGASKGGAAPGPWLGSADAANWGGESWEPPSGEGSGAEKKKWNTWTKETAKEQEEESNAMIEEAKKAGEEVSSGKGGKSSKGKGKSAKGKGKGKDALYDAWSAPDSFKGGKKGKGKGKSEDSWDWNATRSALPLGAEITTLGGDMKPLGFTPRPNAMGLEQLEKSSAHLEKELQALKDAEDAKIEEARKASALRAAEMLDSTGTAGSSKDITMHVLGASSAPIELSPRRSPSPRSRATYPHERIQQRQKSVEMRSPSKPTRDEKTRPNYERQNAFDFGEDNNVLSRMAAIESLRKRDPPDLTGGALGVTAEKEPSAEFLDFKFTSTSTFEDAKPTEAGSKANPWANDILPPAPADAELKALPPVHVPLPADISGPWEAPAAETAKTAESDRAWDGDSKWDRG